jgi:hypothetical protein
MRIGGMAPLLAPGVNYANDIFDDAVWRSGV